MPRIIDPGDSAGGKRFRKTHQDIQDAFLALAASMPFEAISVPDICKGASLHRTTFYQHYGDKHEILGDCLLQLRTVPPEVVEIHAGKPLEQMIDQLMELIGHSPEGQRSRLDRNCRIFLGGALFHSLFHWVKYGSEEKMEEFCTSIGGYVMATLRIGHAAGI